MEGDGKESNQYTTADMQEPLQRSDWFEIDHMQKADISTGWACLRLMLNNKAILKRLRPQETTWLHNHLEALAARSVQNAIMNLATVLRPDYTDQKHTPPQRRGLTAYRL